MREIDRFAKIMWHVTVHRPEIRWLVWRLVLETLARNPRVIRDVVVAVVFYSYLGPLSQFVVAYRETEIAELRAGRGAQPRVLPARSDEAVALAS